MTAAGMVRVLTGGTLLALGLSACASGAPAPPPPAALSSALKADIAPAVYPLTPDTASVMFATDAPLLGAVTGEFTAFDGTLDIVDAAAGKAALSATLAIDSLSTDRAFVRSTVLGEGWFAVARWPEARFDGVLSGWNEDGAGDVRGTLTVRDVTRPEAFTVRLTCAGVDDCPARAVGFEGDLTIDRTAYGMTASRGLVAREVTIRVSGILPMRTMVAQGDARDQ